MSKKLEAIRLQRGAISENLKRTEDRLPYGAEKASAFLDLLRNPGQFSQQAPDVARRDLLLTFFTRLFGRLSPERARDKQKPPPT